MRSVGSRQRRWGALTIAVALAGAGPTRAQAQQATSSTAKVAAETLFEEGRRLMADGKVATPVLSSPKVSASIPRPERS